jgi:peptidoglycan hydrolase CwlO-like protein
MKKIFTILLLIICVCQATNAKPSSDNDKIKSLDEKCVNLQNQQSRIANDLCRLKDKQKESDRRIQALKSDNNRQSAVIDSLRNTCKQLTETQSADRKSVNGMIDKTNSNVQANQETLQSRTLLVCIIAILMLVVIVGVTYRLAKRIKSGSTSIDEVRKAQDALQAAQTKMQEESIKLDDKLLELFDRQIANASKNVSNDKPDHSLVLKVADEVARIELNMSRMDSSIRGYKQLSKAVGRIKDNFNANGYEIVDMLGKPYNEGMKAIAEFVLNEDLEEGQQIITGITKPQINYNGQMIQAAQIIVSQKI